MGRVHHEPKLMVLTLLWNMSSCAILGCMTDNQLTEKGDLATIRRAAAQIRNDRGGVVSRNTQDGRRWLPVAAWLDTAGADLWAHGPLHCADGCDDCDDDLWMPHVRRALAVARAYLGEEPNDA